MSITPEQCRAARALLGLSQIDLCAQADIAHATLVHFERSDRKPMVKNMTAIQSALEKAGVEFIAENGGGAGVRLKKRR